MTNGEKELAGFFSRFEPATAKLGQALRSKLRARLPGLYEVVYLYENQKSLVLSYSPTENGYEALCTLAVKPSDVKLYFSNAAQLAKADPNKLLQGSAKTVRYVNMSSVADFDRAEIEALIAAAVKLAKVRLDASATGSIVIRAEEQKQRAQRTKKAATRKAPKTKR